MLQTFFTILLILLGLLGVAMLGFVIPPRPFREHPAPSRPGEPAPFRPGLPEPVQRHFRDTLGDMPEQIHTALIWGRGKVNIRGVWLPMRFKAWYRPGDAFYRRLELTWFQRPVLRGQDAWINQQGVYEMGGRVERGEGIDEGQVLTLWADAVWMPSVFVHDARLRWEAVTEHTARLVLPFASKGQKAEDLLAHFDPLSGQMTHFTALRFSPNEEAKAPWRVDLMAWKKYQNFTIPCQIAIAWGESGSPVSYWDVDGIAYNVNVSDQLGD